MGYRCRWIAVRGGAGDAVLAQLGLRVESRTGEPVFDPGLYGVALDGGWYVVMADGREYMTDLNENQASGLSSAGDTLSFYTDDSRMCGRLAAYSHGRLVWAISYDGSQGAARPDIEGAPPALVADQQRRLGEDSQYGLGAAVGFALTGFRHDRTLASTSVPRIDVLSRT